MLWSTDDDHHARACSSSATPRSVVFIPRARACGSMLVITHGRPVKHPHQPPPAPSLLPRTHCPSARKEAGAHLRRVLLTLRDDLVCHAPQRNKERKRRRYENDDEAELRGAVHPPRHMHVNVVARVAPAQVVRSI